MGVIKSVVGAGALILVQLVIAAPVWAACRGTSPNLTAVSANQTDIRDCLDAAANGDTITVPAGSATWTSTLTITKLVKLVASGTVTITDNSAGGDPDGGGGPPLITISESTAGNIRIQGFTFVQGTGAHLGGNGGIIKMAFTSGGKPILVTGNTFTQGKTGNAIVAATNRGVIWGNTFTGVPSYNRTPGDNCFNNTSALRHYATAVYASSWTTPSTMGTADTDGTQNLYFENNTVTNMNEAFDTNIGGRTVYRYNIITNSGLTLHGDTSIGSRHVEFYNNTILYNTSPMCPGPLPMNLNGFIEARGGTLLVHHNTIPHIDGGGAWGSKSEVTFNLQSIRRAGGTWPCWGTTVPGGYPAPYQFGWGYMSGGTQAGTTGVFMDPEPVYLWANTGAGNYGSPAVLEYSPNECGSSAPTITNFIQSGRDYFTNRAKPGYETYTYPHPLAGSALPPPTSSALPRPTNLKVQ
jgi:hypothetical protein